jgi:hypothetical protein
MLWHSFSLIAGLMIAFERAVGIGKSLIVFLLDIRLGSQSELIGPDAVQQHGDWHSIV